MEKVAPSSIRMSVELKAGIHEFATLHHRSDNEEMVWALELYVKQERQKMQQQIAVDTLFSKGKLHTWLVKGDRNHSGEWLVQSDTSGHACDFICATVWVPRISLTASQGLAEQNKRPDEKYWDGMNQQGKTIYRGESE